MNRTVTLVIAALVILAGIIWFTGRSPEEAVQTATDAANTATEAAGDAAEAAGDAAGAAADAVNSAAGALSAELSGLLDGAGLSSLQDTLSGLNLDGFDASLLDPANFDLNSLMESLGAAGLAQDASASLQGVIEQASASPDLLSELLAQIKALLGL